MERRYLAIVFCLAFAVCALVTKPHVASWNDASRLATIDALVNHGSFAIDASPFAAATKDKYHFDSRTYSDKPPALALCGAAVATILAPLEITLARTPATAIYLITLFTVGIWFGVGATYAYALQRLLGFGVRAAAAVAALSAVATLNLPYASVLANHVPSGAAALAGLYHLARVREAYVHAVAAALFLSLAYAFDAAAVVFAVCAAIMLWGVPRRRWAAFAAACIPIVALQLAYNVHVSGAFWPPGINEALWLPPPSPIHRVHQSLFQSTSAAAYGSYFLYITIGDKGLFSYTPLTIVCAFGFARMWTMPPPMRRIALAVLATFGLYLGLIVAFTGDYGAHNFGQRRYVDVFFVLCVALGPALAAIRGRFAVMATRAAIVASVAIAALGTVAPFADTSVVPGYVFEPVEFANLARRAPLQAIVDVIATIGLILLMLRLSSIGSVSKPDTGRRGA